VTPTIGLDVGGTKVLGALVDPAGGILAEHRVPSPDGWDALAGAMLDLIGTLREADVSAVGIGAAGMVDHDGVIHYAPNIPGFRNVAVRATIADATGLSVVVDNDANAAAWGEVVHGAARGARDALVITLGTGIGGGIIADGGVYRGAHGFAAEIGHFTVDSDGPVCACGARGHWEAMASGTALGRMGRDAAAAGAAPSVLREAGGDPAAVNSHHVGEAVLAGEPDAVALLERYADYVAMGLAALCNILDPGVIVVSGGLVALGEALLAPVRRSLVSYIEGGTLRPVPDVVLATLGERAGVIGAAALARELTR